MWSCGAGLWGGDIQAGDQRRALDDRSNCCVGLAWCSLSRLQRYESNSDVS